MTVSLPYLAGFFDGEGCINITVHGRNRQTCLRVTLVNTNYEFLQQVQAQYGGALRHRAQTKNPTWKPFCSLEWINAEAGSLLESLLPHLIIKSPQARLALEFRNFMKLPKTERCDFKFSPAPGMPRRVLATRKPEVLLTEAEFKAKMHALNRKGVEYAN